MIIIGVDGGGGVGRDVGSIYSTSMEPAEGVWMLSVRRLANRPQRPKKGDGNKGGGRT